MKVLSEYKRRVREFLSKLAEATEEHHVHWSMVHMAHRESYTSSLSIAGSMLILYCDSKANGDIILQESDYSFNRSGRVIASIRDEDYSDGLWKLWRAALRQAYGRVDLIEDAIHRLDALNALNPRSRKDK